jgi:hypothetical protein
VHGDAALVRVVNRVADKAAMRDAGEVRVQRIAAELERLAGAVNLDVVDLKVAAFEEDHVRAPAVGGVVAVKDDDCA